VVSGHVPVIDGLLPHEPIAIHPEKLSNLPPLRLLEVVLDREGSNLVFREGEALEGLVFCALDVEAYVVDERWSIRPLEDVMIVVVVSLTGELT
jgi:hypothetical protein